MHPCYNNIAKQIAVEYHLEELGVLGCARQVVGVSVTLNVMFPQANALTLLYLRLQFCELTGSARSGVLSNSLQQGALLQAYHLAEQLVGLLMFAGLKVRCGHRFL